MKNVSDQRPRLRAVEVERVTDDGRSFLLLKDLQRIAGKSLVMKEELGPYLALADGRLTVEEIIGSAQGDGGSQVTAEAVRDLFEQLDRLFLLEGPAYEREAARLLDEYRSADFRMPALEGQAYPEDPDELLDQIEGFAPDVSDEQEPTGKTLRAIVSPHIDFARGGDTYAELWRQAAPDLEDIELAVVFGTDHNGQKAPLTLTNQSYATPWNIMPTDRDLVSKLARILERDDSPGNHPFAEEFNHRSEHSIELATIWLNWAVGDRAVKLLPVLCGSFATFVHGDSAQPAGSPRDNPLIADAIGLLQQVARHRRTVFIAAADLAHVGPAFGDEISGESALPDRIRAYDSELMDAVVTGRPDAVLEVVRRERDYSRICGLAPLYMALRAAEATGGEWMGYRQCPADQAGDSFVSVAGALLYGGTPGT